MKFSKLSTLNQFRSREHIYDERDELRYAYNHEFQIRQNTKIMIELLCDIRDLLIEQKAAIRAIQKQLNDAEP